MSPKIDHNSNDPHQVDENATNSSTWFLVGQVATNEPVRYHAVGDSPFMIGRRSDLALWLRHATVSSLHAEITTTAEALLIHDLKSTNGTFVNGVRVTDAASAREGDIVQFSNLAFRVRCEEAVPSIQTEHSDGAVQAVTLIQFERLMDEQAVVAFFQPIVQFDTRRPIGYEVLGRSQYYGLNNPREMFQVAFQLNLEAELSRMFRTEGIRKAAMLPGDPDLFVNTHPIEVSDSGLIVSLESARSANPDLPITLEIHEATVADPASMRELRSALSELDIRLAYDDFGAGQARLIELAEVPPDVLKFDMTLIREIDRAPAERQQMIAALVTMVADLGITPLAEGIETEGEAATCDQLGFELAQGFYFGKPSPVQRILSES